MWGNFKVGYLDNELAHVDRGLYGANAHYSAAPTTSFGERRFTVDGFAAQRERWRAMSNSANGRIALLPAPQDILTGSERVRIEIRDKASSIVTGVVNLQTQCGLRHRLPAGPGAAFSAALVDR